MVDYPSLKFKIIYWNFIILIKENYIALYISLFLLKLALNLKALKNNIYVLQQCFLKPHMQKIRSCYVNFDFYTLRNKF